MTPPPERANILAPISFGAGLLAIFAFSGSFLVGCCCGVFAGVLHVPTGLIAIAAVVTGALGQHQARTETGRSEPLAVVGMLLGALVLVLQIAWVVVFGGMTALVVLADKL